LVLLGRFTDSKYLSWKEFLAAVPPLFPPLQKGKSGEKLRVPGPRRKEGKNHPAPREARRKRGLGVVNWEG